MTGAAGDGVADGTGRPISRVGGFSGDSQLALGQHGGDGALLGRAGKWLPAEAGNALTSLGQNETGVLNPALAAIVLVGWGVVVSLIASRVTMRREVR